MKRLGFLLLACALLGATSARAQITLRGSTSASVASLTAVTHVGAGGAASRNNCGSINPGIPGGNVGDLLVALVNAREASATVTMAGWNQAYTDTFPAVDLQVFIFWRFATGADPNTVTQSGTCSSLGARISRFRGADPTQPLETDPIPAGNVVRQNSGAIDTGTQTTTYNLSMLVVASFIDNDRTVTAGAGWSQSFDTALNITRDMGLALHYLSQTTPASTSVTGWDLSGAGTDNNYGILFAIRPAPSQLDVAVPAGSTLGDTMIASIGIRPCSNVPAGACTVAVTPPAGWTLVRGVDQTSGGGTGGEGDRLFVYQRIATATEPATYTWTFTGPPGNAGAAGSIATFQGVDVSSPIVAEAGQATASSLSHDAPGIDTGIVANTMLVATFTANASGSWTPPGTMTEMQDLSSSAAPNTVGLTLATAMEFRAATGVTGTRTATFSASPGATTGATHLLALRPAPVRFDILSGDFAVRCAAFPIPVTIIARDANGNLLQNFANLVNITTAPATGDWSIGIATGALNNGAGNDGAATYQYSSTDRGIVRLDLAVTTATSLTITVQDSVTGSTSSSLVPITFGNDGYTVVLDPIQVAGRPQTLTVEHRVAPGCGLSTANGHGGNNAVKVWLTLDPSHPAGAAIPGGVGVTAVSPLPTAEPGANNITLNFAGPGALAPGQAPLTLNTSDVGKYIVNIRDTNTARRGSSAPITTRPFALGMPGIGHSTSPAGTVLAAAGANFNLTVTGYQWAAGDDANNDGVPDAGANVTDNATTASYAWATTLSVGTGLSSPAGGILPSGGTVGALTIGATSPASLAQGAFSGGSATSVTTAYSEVGSVFIAATATDYLYSPGVVVTGDSGQDGTGAAGGFVGRFRPDHLFVAAGSTLTNRSAAACAPASTFSYLGEGMALAFTLQARNTALAVTQNYAGTYAKLNPATIAQLGLGAASGATNLTSRLDLSAGSAGSFASGQAAVTATVGVARAVPDNPDGPFTAAKIGVAPSDSDGVTARTADLNLDVDGVGGNDHVQVGGDTELRFGRLRLQNALGSEKLALPVPIETQYWSGGAFVTNTLDSCTSIPRSAVALGSYTGALSPAPNCLTFVQQNPISFAGGAGTLTLAAPSGGASGSLLLTPNLGTASTGSFCSAAGVVPTSPATAAGLGYLLGRWDDAANPDANANTGYDDKPSARAAFGLYGSQPGNFIYFRENY